MANYSHQMARTLAAVTKNVIGAALVRSEGNAAERPRSVSEILDVRHSFVCGYPQHIEANRRSAEID